MESKSEDLKQIFESQVNAKQGRLRLAYLIKYVLSPNEERSILMDTPVGSFIVEIPDSWRETARQLDLFQHASKETKILRLMAETAPQIYADEGRLPVEIYSQVKCLRPFQCVLMRGCSKDVHAGLSHSLPFRVKGLCSDCRIVIGELNRIRANDSISVQILVSNGDDLTLLPLGGGSLSDLVAGESVKALEATPMFQLSSRRVRPFLINFWKIQPKVENSDVTTIGLWATILIGPRTSALLSSNANYRQIDSDDNFIFRDGLSRDDVDLASTSRKEIKVRRGLAVTRGCLGTAIAAEMLHFGMEDEEPHFCSLKSEMPEGWSY